MGISYVEYLANPKYRKYPFKGLIGWILANRPPSVEDLQSKYEFRYYSTMNKAVTDVNNGTTANADAEKGTAVAGVYTDENGGKNVVLLKDHTEATRLKTFVNMTINLGGNTFSCSDGVAIDIYSGNITINGNLAGSSIETTTTNNNSAKVLQIRSGKVIVNGGTYVGNSDGYGTGTTNIAPVIHLAAGELSINNATLLANDETGRVSCVGVGNNGIATVTNCNIKAYSNYISGTDEYYSAMSQGISNSGTLTLNNCYVMGTHIGVQSTGALTVNGGTYEGVGHGGFYFAGASSTSYVRDAIIRDCEMPDGYTQTATRNGAGFYIGGEAGKDNITVYMDNCRISGLAESQTIVLRGSSGEKNNSLYISNSTINTLDGRMGRIRIDNDTHRLYIGAGNNFTAENTSLPEAVVVTDEVYREVA